MGLLVAVAEAVIVGVDVAVRASEGIGVAVLAGNAALAEAGREFDGVTEGMPSAARLSECEYQ